MRFIRSMRQAQIREDSVLFYPDNWGSPQAWKGDERTPPLTDTFLSDGTQKELLKRRFQCWIDHAKMPNTMPAAEKK